MHDESRSSRHERTQGQAALEGVLALQRALQERLRLPEPAGEARPAGRSLWQTLNLERVARRLIQTAHMAAAEHVMGRADRLLRRREELRRQAKAG